MSPVALSSIGWMFAGIIIIASSLQSSAQAQSAYDGTYFGSMAIAQDRSLNQTAVFGNRGAVRGEFNGRLGACNAGPYQKNLMIRNGQFSFIFNNQAQIILNGTVAGNGSVTAFLPSVQGGIKLTAQIAGSDLVGTVGSAYCIYALQLRKQA